MAVEKCKEREREEKCITSIVMLIFRVYLFTKFYNKQSTLTHSNALISILSLSLFRSLSISLKLISPTAITILKGYQLLIFMIFTLA